MSLTVLVTKILVNRPSCCQVSSVQSIFDQSSIDQEQWASAHCFRLFLVTSVNRGLETALCREYPRFRRLFLMTCSLTPHSLKGPTASSKYVIWRLSRHEQINSSSLSTWSLVRDGGRPDDFRGMCPRLMAVETCLGSSLSCCAISCLVLPLSWSVNTCWIFSKI